MGKGRRGKKRRAAEGGKGKDDARWRTRRRRMEWKRERGEGETRGGGRQAGEGTKGEAKDAK